MPHRRYSSWLPPKSSAAWHSAQSRSPRCRGPVCNSVESHPAVAAKQGYYFQINPISLAVKYDTFKLVNICLTTRKQTGGFFIECGAADGESGSNTLYMERYLDWQGVLIEADRKFYDRLLTRKRKSYAPHVCLSLKPHPTTVIYNNCIGIYMYITAAEAIKYLYII